MHPPPPMHPKIPPDNGFGSPEVWQMKGEHSASLLSSSLRPHLGSLTTREKGHPTLRTPEEGGGLALLHGSFGTRGTQPHAALASKAPSGPRRAHAQARVQDRGQLPRPLAFCPWAASLCLRPFGRNGAWCQHLYWQKGQVIGHQLIQGRQFRWGVGVSLPQQTLSLQTPPLRPLSSAATFACHCPPAGQQGLQAWSRPGCHLLPSSTRVLPDEPKLRHFQSVPTRGFWDFYGCPPNPGPSSPRSLCLGANASEDPSQVD